MVRVDGLVTRLGETLVHDGLSLHVPTGTFAALIGPSGCGKTTLLRTLAGLLPPAVAGTVDVQGRSAFVFQHPSLFPWANVLDNAVFGMEATGRVDRARAAELLGSMGLGDWLTSRPAQLSAGMQQRVNLARALLVDPDVLLLDEPFSALDALTRRALWNDLLTQVTSRPMTVVLVSHALDEVVALADDIHVLTGIPARVHAVLSIPVPHPRDAAGRRQDCTELQAQLAADLMAASQAGT